MTFLECSLWFFGGIFSYKILSRIVAHVQMSFFVQIVTEQCLKMMGMLAEDVAFAKSLKYKALHESGLSDEQIDQIREVDAKAFTNWKITTVVKFIVSYPKQYQKLLGFYDWDGAMKVLSDIYIKEAKAKSGRTYKSDNT